MVFSALFQPISIVNPHPTSNNIPYPCVIDSSSLFTLKDIMELWKNINSYYSAHAHSLQTFVEKITVFYKDDDLTQTSLGGDEPAKIYNFVHLYDRYIEYVNLLSLRWLVKQAVAFLKFTSPGYKGSSSGIDLGAERDQLIAATSTLHSHCLSNRF